MFEHQQPEPRSVSGLARFFPTHSVAVVTSGPMPSPDRSAMRYRSDIELVNSGRAVHDELEARLHVAAH
jgi:hypothetical protein